MGWHLLSDKRFLMKYTELQVTSNFSFLRGASHPEELVEQAVQFGYDTIAIADHNTLAGIVRAHVEAKKAGIRLIVGCCLNLLDGPSLLAFPKNKNGYSRLTALLSEGNLRAEKGDCHLYKTDVFTRAGDIIFIVVPPAELDCHFKFDETFITSVKEYKEKIGNDLYLAASRSYQANDAKRLHRLIEISEQFGIPLVATNNVYYHNRERRELQDVLTCVREKCTIYNAGFHLYQNAERHLKTEKEMARLFRQHPEMIERTQEIVSACSFLLDELKYVYPKEITSGGRTPQEELERLTWKGAIEKFGEDVSEKLMNDIKHELDFIERKNYASYFLTVYDYVKFARDQNILCQGRGSAANSIVCYCLGITSVNPSKFKLLFARFMSDARDEPPDIDMDFEHERREEVIQYIYKKYGRNRAAIVATVTQLHEKGAVRDVGKAMGLSVDAVDKLSKSLWEFTKEWYDGKKISSEGFNPNDKHLQKVLHLTRQFMGFPRQLGQHTGGFVITEKDVTELCPIINARMEGRTNIEWNKDDIEALGFLKVDVLALGMLTCIRKAFDLLKQHHKKEYELHTIPEDDKNVYDMICRADTIGVFQIESRAQMTMLPRLQPREFYDLVIEVAIVRPGPIQGDMVHPYLRRRNKEEPVEYPSEEIKHILKRTLGVPLFQEQAMEIAMVAARFSAADADGLRRSMATFKAKGKVSEFEQKLIKGMMDNGYEEAFARRVFRQLEGFGSYGFPESHAASFALLVYVSAWIKYHYPDVFCTALLNSLPMGFYQPAQIVIDARKHGVDVKPVDINYSHWDNTLETFDGKYFTVRLGFRQVKGLKEEEMKLLIQQKQSPYSHIHQLRDAGISETAILKLTKADAFRSINMDRRQALWQASALNDRLEGLFKGWIDKKHIAEDANTALPQMNLPEHVVHDYASVSLSLKAHPVSFFREKLTEQKVIATSELALKPDGAFVRVAGLVLIRQRPGTAKGICFVTIEDETGCANLVVFQNVFDTYRKEVLRSQLLMAEGIVQREGDVIHVIAGKCYDLKNLINNLATSSTKKIDLSTTSPADEKDGKLIPRELTGNSKRKKVVQAEIFPKSRDFK